MPKTPVEFSVKKAHEAQRRLCKKLILEDNLPKEIRYVAGVDTAYWSEKSICAVAVLDYTSLKVIEVETALYRTPFPYIPTLLSFREIPPTVLCIKQLHVQPDIFLVDGQGYAHPYRCGFASHLGLVLGKPTIGVAKSRLIGEVQQLSKPDEIRLLIDKNEVIGAEVRTKQGSKPVYVSIGHMVSLNKAIEIVKHCTVSNKIPEPILIAHKAATDEKRKLNNEQTRKTAN
jgi:deoxyribonuclease V